MNRPGGRLAEELLLAAATASFGDTSTLDVLDHSPGGRVFGIERPDRCWIAVPVDPHGP